MNYEKEVVSIHRGVISYNLGKNVLFEKIDYGENLLMLYNNTSAHKHILQNFMRKFANDASIIFYVSHKTNQLNFSFDVRNFSFNILNDDVIHDLKRQLDKYFAMIEENSANILLICDWSNINLSNNSIFVPFLESIIEKSQSLCPPGWKRKYNKRVRQKNPIIIVNVFETTNLNDEFIQQIIKLHQRVYLLQENLATFLLPAISSSLETLFPKYHILQQDVLEKLLKDNLELVIFLLLERNNKSGYQLLKEIAQNFHCILSQGTLYPLLYQLEKKNKIMKQNGKGREVVYSLTQETKNELQSRKETCLKAYQYLASFFDSGGVIKIKQMNKVFNAKKELNQND